MKFALATFHRALATALLTVLLASESHVHAQSSASIYAATLPPNWPTTLAAVIPATLKLSSAPVFTWSFPTAQNPSCTADGRQNVSPCVGRVVDHWFPTASRNHTVVLTITDSTLSSPMRVEQRIVILAAGAQPQAKRPEIRAVPQAMWTDKYVPAFYRMKELGVYDHLAAIHRAAFSVGVVPGMLMSLVWSGQCRYCVMAHSHHIIIICRRRYTALDCTQHSGISTMAPCVLAHLRALPSRGGQRFATGSSLLGLASGFPGCRVVLWSGR